MKKHLLILIMTLPLFVISQTITSITPNQANQGQTIPLIISGQNTDFNGWSSCGSSILPGSFKFSQLGGVNVMEGVVINSTNNQVNGSLTVPAFQPIGAYNLEVFCANVCSWLVFSNSFFINSATSTQLENIEDISFYPNPTHAITNIQFTSLIAQDIKIMIYDNIGKIIFSENMAKHTGIYTKKIDLSNNAKGIYFLNIETNYGVMNHEIILK